MKSFFILFSCIIVLSERAGKVWSQTEVHTTDSAPVSNSMSTFPTTLKGFGYAFNDDGELRQIDPKNNDSITDKPFKYEVSDNTVYNEARYDALYEVIIEHVYQMLQDAGLHKIYVPSLNSTNSSFVFGTKTDFKNTKKLMILIQGSGVVRAGMWSSSLIFEQSTNHGTQLPYVKRAIELGYDVLVTNTNNNYRYEDGEQIELNGNQTPEDHITSVWEQLIAPAYDTIDSFAVVAHSYGGVVTLKMANNYPDALLEKCFGIAFTDSVHRVSRIPGQLLDWFKMNARNYVTSSAPLGTKFVSRRPAGDIPRYSAGHTEHKWTSWACIDALFPFLEEKYTAFTKNEEEKKQNEMTTEMNH